MGTRHLTVVVVDGIHRVAQYGQWDGYPDGQGVTVTAFLHDVLTNNRLGEFEDKVRATQWVTNEQLEAMWVQAGAPKGATSVSLDISDRFEKLFPELHRDTGAVVLQRILDSDKPLLLRDDMTFGLTGLFCEFAYVIDLDAKTLEFYKGFNKDPVKNAPRFMALPNAESIIADDGSGYQAVSHVYTFSFDEITREGAQAIVNSMNKLIGADEDEG